MSDQPTCRKCGKPIEPCSRRTIAQYCRRCVHYHAQPRVCIRCGVPVGRKCHYCDGCRILADKESKSRYRQASPKLSFAAVRCGTLGTLYGIAVQNVELDGESCIEVRMVHTRASEAFPKADVVRITPKEFLQSVGLDRESVRKLLSPDARCRVE